MTRLRQVLIAGVVLVFVGYNLFFVYVRPDEYGIKVARVGINRGVQKKIYHAGLTFVLPFGLQKIYRLPKGIQVLELTNYPETAAGASRKDRAAHIQTSDGFYVDVGVICVPFILNLLHSMPVRKIPIDFHAAFPGTKENHKRSGQE